jgi:hypothetical protein
LGRLMSPTACPNRLNHLSTDGFLQLRKPPTCENDSRRQVPIFSHDLCLCGEYFFTRNPEVLKN